MSEARRLRRETRLKEKKQGRRVVDWNKVKKLAKQVTFAYCAFMLFAFIASFASATINNNRRKAALKNPVETTGTIIRKYTSKGNTHTTYQFSAQGKNYSANAFQEPSGGVGADICIVYNKTKPDDNICCEEKEMQKPFTEALSVSLIVMAIGLPFSIIMILGGMLFGNRKLIAEVTSRTTD